MTDALKHPEFGLVIVSAIQYAVGRQTYLPSAITSFIRAYWHAMPKEAHLLIVFELANPMGRYLNKGESYALGSETIDTQDWLDLYIACYRDVATRYPDDIFIPGDSLAQLAEAASVRLRQIQSRPSNPSSFVINPTPTLSPAKYSWSEITENRLKWIEKLEDPKTVKTLYALENKDHPEQRCCLGHAAALFVPETRVRYDTDIYYDGDFVVLSTRLRDMLGLYTSTGAVPGKNKDKSLTVLNDECKWSPQKIGAYLRTVLDGGPHTPFRPQSHYPDDEVAPG